ncbi:diguanylate cyclase [Bosea sp. RAF48]|uniref:GGDEF domain-containing protein n=1 Tax=Bosea sp. RAF48 TaxID=3237480 RepID=UPI003F908C68
MPIARASRPNSAADFSRLDAQQRARGFRLLRFEPLLEAEFLDQMRREQKPSATICTATALLIWIGFGAFDLVRLDYPAEIAAWRPDFVAGTGLRLLTLVVLSTSFGLLVASDARRIYPWMSLFALILVAAGAAVNANVYKVRGIPHAELACFAIVMAVFLPLGMTFRQSLFTAVSTALSVAIAGLLMLDVVYARETITLAAMLAFAAFVGAVGAYLREYAQRDKFLLRRMLQQLAMLDPLTGLANRRHFGDHAVAALQSAYSDNSPAALIVLDVDYFKRFNDTYGHQRGDFALKLVAQRLSTFTRHPQDLVGRLGGEEFAILIIGLDASRTAHLVGEIVRSILELRISHGSSDAAAFLSVSAGIASFDGGESLESLYRRADTALYEAKRCGRNCYRVAVNYSRGGRAEPAGSQLRLVVSDER